MTTRLFRARVAAGCLVLLIWSVTAARGQTAPAKQPEPQTVADPLGRDTPRGTVMGFFSAARRGETEIARQYFNTRLTGDATNELSRQLFVILDARLPARLRQLNDEPEGSRANPLQPDQEVVGTIASAGGDVEVIVERVSRPGGERIWLFSGTTLASVSALYQEVTADSVERYIPAFLTRTRFGGIRLFEWVIVLLGVPFFYLLTALLNRILTPAIRFLWRKITRQSDLFDRNVLPTPVRLLILSFAIRWTLSRLPLPLLARQFWSNLAILLTIVGIVWLLILLNGEVERYVRRHFPRASLSAGAALVRVLRRMVDILVIFGGLLAILRHYGVDATPALAGLGVGGIAVALAAQKTLENVIAGASLIFDNAVRVGDSLKVGQIQGTVDHIGLRSTRIRTPDRTIVSVPNGQIANMSLETMSARDKYWFHPVVGIRCDTRPDELRAVVHGFRRLLGEYPAVEKASARVRFVSLGEFSLNIEMSAYVSARDWDHFLEIQEELLFRITDVVEAAGTEIAFRSATPYATPARQEVPGSRV